MQISRYRKKQKTGVEIDLVVCVQGKKTDQLETHVALIRRFNAMGD